MELQLFKFNTSRVRTLAITGSAWFVAGDIAKVLGYRSAPDMVRMLDDDESCVHSIESASESGVVQSRATTLVSESGLYSLALRSQREEAKPFRRWVTSEVLPSIRTKGGYISTTATLDQLQTLQAQITTLQEEHKRNLASLDDFHESALRNLRHAAEAASKKTSRTYGPAEELAKQMTLLQRQMKGVEVQNTLAEKILEKVYDPKFPAERIKALLKARQKVADDRAKGPSRKISGFMPWIPCSIADLELYATEQF